MKKILYLYKSTKVYVSLAVCETSFGFWVGVGVNPRKHEVGRCVRPTLCFFCPLLKKKFPNF